MLLREHLNGSTKLKRIYFLFILQSHFNHKNVSLSDKYKMDTFRKFPYYRGRFSNMFLFSYYTSIIHIASCWEMIFLLYFTSKSLIEKDITTIICIKLQCSQGWFQHEREICRVVGCYIMGGEDEESPTFTYIGSTKVWKVPRM